MNHVRSFLAFVLVLAAVGRFTWGQSDPVDRANQLLDRARKTYEEAMEGLREDVNRAMKLKISAAGSKDADAVKQAGAESDAFNATGTWPNVPRLQQLRERAARAAGAMQDAYAKALAEYTKSGNAALREAVTAESDQFDDHSDIVPWSSNLIADKPEPDRTVTGTTAVSIDIAIKDSYRVEVAARRSTDSGVMILDFPINDGNHVAVPVSTSVDGKVSVLLTIGDEMVCANLGVTRPILLGGATASDKRQISVRADSGTFVIESIRVKPVVEGEPEKLAERPKRVAADKEKTNDQGAADFVGSKWSGTFRNAKGSHNATATLRSVDGNRVVFRVNVGDYGTRDWVFVADGSSLVLNECIIVKTAGNAAIKSIRISGVIRNKTLRVSGSWVWQRSSRGGGEEIGLELAMD